MLYCILCNSIETTEKGFAYFFNIKAQNDKYRIDKDQIDYYKDFFIFLHKFFIKTQQRVKECLEHKLEQTHILNCYIECNSL